VLARQLLRCFFALALPFLLVMAALRFTLSDAYLRLAYQRPSLPRDAYGMNTAARLHYGPQALPYILGELSAAQLQALRLPRELCTMPADDAPDCPLLNERARQHLYDVRRLLLPAMSGAALTLALALLAVLLARQRRHWQPAIAQGLLRGAQGTLLALFALALLALVAWDSAFENFHKLFFPAGTWRFPYSDNLIRLYPEQLFADAALVIAGIVGAGAALAWWLCMRWLRHAQSLPPHSA